MSEKFYETPAAFDRALKDLAKNSAWDTGALYRQALRDRFLCRVFYGGNANFVLKGGSGLLARVSNARATRDVDFASQVRVDSQTALEEMKRIASIDLDDWCNFRLLTSTETLDDNGYSRLLKLKFATLVGDIEKDPILIDLSLDCSSTLPPEKISPANRINIKGVTTCDYLVYSLPDQMADKFCAITEIYQGCQSSRMKDLFDVVTYLTNESFKFGEVKDAILNECSARKMKVPSSFTSPSLWKDRFPDFAKRNGLDSNFVSFESANNLAMSFFNSVLTDEFPSEAKWNPTTLEWNTV